MKCFSLWFFALLVAVPVACGPTPGSHATAQALLAADRAFASLSEHTGVGAAFAEYTAPDGILLPRTGNGPVEGRGNVMALFDGAREAGYRLLWTPRFAEVSTGGDMGWTWGTYRVEVNGVVTRNGKYLNVWKRQPDGRWKVRAEIGNLRPAEDAD